MELSESQTEEGKLVAICEEGVEMFCAGSIEEFVERFNYALSYDREPVEALHHDLEVCLRELGAKNVVARNHSAQPQVTFYKENSENLFAVVGMRAFADNGRELLLEFVVSSAGVKKHLTLEDVSAISA